MAALLLHTKSTKNSHLLHYTSNFDLTKNIYNDATKFTFATILMLQNSFF